MSIAISIPGSKSITNRALILASLRKGTTTIKNAAICDDTLHMIAGLKKLGVKITKSGTIIKIKGGFKKSKTPIKIDTGNAGTTTRFLTALATLTGNEVHITGDKRMCERPIHELTKTLNKLGAKVKDTNGCPPLTIYPQPPIKKSISIPGNISSQYISALMMIGARVKITGKVYSKPYIDMTRSMIKNFAQSKKDTYTVEADASSASYIGAYAALHKKSVFLKSIHQKSIQGDIKFLTYLKKMGCRISHTKEGTRITGPETLKSLGKVDMNETPDLVMTFAVLAMFTPGRTQITNIANLRIKETDRLHALENEIKKFGIKVRTTKSSITIEGDQKSRPSGNAHTTKKITIETYNDHRIAMAFGILHNTNIKNPSCVSKSYSAFWRDIKKLKNAK